jgi:hypothetical protein
MVQISEERKALFAWPAAQRPLSCSNPKQTTTLAGIIKTSAIFTPGTLLKALAHEYIFIFLRIEIYLLLPYLLIQDEGCDTYCLYMKCGW